MIIQIAEKYVRLYLLTYLWVSFLFSMIIHFRLAFAHHIGFFNVVVYDIYYYVMPSIAVFILVLGRKQGSKRQSDVPASVQSATIMDWVALATVALILICIDFSFNTPLSYVVFPAIPVFMMCLYFNSKEVERKLLSKKIVAFALAIVILLPYAMAFLGFNSAISVIKATQIKTDRAELASDYVSSITASFWGLTGLEGGYFILHRARSDFLKFLMVGVGSCGEMAHTTKGFFDSLDLESRIVSFPGEDHMFVEIKLNDTLLVVDPGYGMNLVTREERASMRLRELGGLSYVVAHTDQGLIEVTNNYVTTDQITIRVTDSGEPIANAKVILKHTFLGQTRPLPEFYSDTNGSVEFSLGPLAYNNSKIEPVEPYYWIWVNGKNTDLKASSTGSGKSVSIEVDLAEGP